MGVEICSQPPEPLEFVLELFRIRRVALRDVCIDQADTIDLGGNETGRVLRLIVKAAGYFADLALCENRYTVILLLAVEDYLVAGWGKNGEREILILYLCLLNAENIRSAFGQPLEDDGCAAADGIRVERCYLYHFCKNTEYRIQKPENSFEFLILNFELLRPGPSRWAGRKLEFLGFLVTLRDFWG